jgi:A/G-specific adenine glycosylase
VKAQLPAARQEIYDLANSLTPESGSGDFAQAMMDLGATICTPRTPACGICPLVFYCRARTEGQPQSYPIKAAKPPKPRRQGVAYWLEHEDHVMLVRRPPKGLLGGMLALPTDGAPAAAAWNEAGSVEHVFTHFALDMKLLCAESAERRNGEIWWPIDRIRDAGLPTLFAKLAARGQEWREAA